MTDSLLSEQIYLSRDSIRELITAEVKRYLELEDVDLTKSSFLSFMIDTISTITGNLLFYQLSSYREFFLTKAQLPESILNLSTFLGYNSIEATAARCDVLITIPFGFDDSDTQFVIPEGFKFSANNEIDFITTYDTTIQVVNNAIVTITVQDGNKKYNLPIDITTDDFSFVLPLKQLKIIEQEFQIDSDIRDYQFVNLDVPIRDQVESLEIYIQNPGSTTKTLWTEFQSLFLMSNSDKGYISKRTDSGRYLTFGNDFFGVQPKADSTVYVSAYTTSGALGNVIPGAVRTGERIYVTTESGATQIVNYEVANNLNAYGGKDEESIEAIRKNSIASIKTLERLVSDGDYKDINTVVPDLPFAQNSLPILKRSDLQVNEISLFNALIFGSGDTEVDTLVPTRNAKITINSDVERLERGTIITIGENEYYTLFDLILDRHNTVANYEYAVASMSIIPALETSYTSEYSIYADQLKVSREGNLGVFKLYYKSEEFDSDLTTCNMITKSSGSIRPMVNDSTESAFIVTVDPYTNIPAGEQTFEFIISDPSGEEVCLYSNKLAFRNNLDTYMRSNLVLDGTSTIIYDVPVIEKEYYDGIDQESFELQVLQILINTSDLSERRMLTDFTNIKLSNTYGLLTSMQLNKPTTSSVLDIVTTLPTTCNTGDRFIYSPDARNNDLQDKIIRCTDSTSMTFIFESPSTNTIVYTESVDKKYIYTISGWLELPIYSIPLEIEIEVFRDLTCSGTLASLQELVRETLVENFKDRFGTKAEIYRSEIIDVVQEIEGVQHCVLRKPESSIFFNFDLKDLTEEQLLEYGPEYIYFIKDSITVRVG